MLAGRVCMAPSNLTPLLHDLTEAGYVRREQDADDRRSYRVWLTDEGREKARLVSAAIDEAFGGNDERARGLHARILDGIAAYHELMGLAPLQSGDTGQNQNRSQNDQEG